MRRQAEWKVETHIVRIALPPNADSSLSRISLAALFVNVMAKICPGAARPEAMRYPMRDVRTRVFPDPAPATTSSGVPECVTASSCCGLSPATILCTRESPAAREAKSDSAAMRPPWLPPGPSHSSDSSARPSNGSPSSIAPQSLPKF